jgi:chromate transporter
VRLAELTQVGFRIGLLGFGGPAGQIALMQREYVERRHWISTQDYLTGMALCSLLPGPEAQQLATWVGYRLRGVTGAVISGGLFVLPGLALILALAGLYVGLGTVPEVAAALLGVQAAVLGFLIEALVKLRRRAADTALSVWIGLLACAGMLAGLPVWLLLAVGAAVGLLIPAPAVRARPPVEGIKRGSALVAGGVALALWLVPVAAVSLALGPEHVLTEVAQVFSLLATFSFGGAYALLGWLQAQAVEVQGWLAASQMVDALGLAETTHGPLVLITSFVGFVAGAQAGEGATLWGLALAGGLLAAWCTFLPSFAWVFLSIPVAERLIAIPAVARALRGVLMVVLGVILALGLHFGAVVLFASPQGVLLGPLVLPDPMSLRPVPALIAALATFLLLFSQTGVVRVVGVCAGLGLAAYMLGA